MLLYLPKSTYRLRHALLVMALKTQQNNVMNKNNDRDLDRRLNWLRAAVLGANDGIVSVAGIVVGVAAAGASYEVILLAGIAAIVAGAISMGGGEFISVSAQRDTEVAHGRNKGSINARPWSAAWSSLLAFVSGAALPLIAITGPWQAISIQATFASVVLALALTGWWAAWVGSTPVLKSIARNVVISTLTMGISYAIGALLGVTVL